ncbi:unnamed protein product, partial [Rangifer tarandus platyrhynchus]
DDVPARSTRAGALQLQYTTPYSKLHAVSRLQRQHLSAWDINSDDLCMQAFRVHAVTHRRTSYRMVASDASYNILSVDFMVLYRMHNMVPRLSALREYTHNRKNYISRTYHRIIAVVRIMTIVRLRTSRTNYNNRFITIDTPCTSYGSHLHSAYAAGYHLHLYRINPYAGLISKVSSRRHIKSVLASMWITDADHPAGSGRQSMRACIRHLYIYHNSNNNASRTNFSCSNSINRSTSAKTIRNSTSSINNNSNITVSRSTSSMDKSSSNTILSSNRSMKNSCGNASLRNMNIISSSSSIKMRNK